MPRNGCLIIAAATLVSWLVIAAVVFTLVTVL